MQAVGTRPRSSWVPPLIVFYAIGILLAGAVGGLVGTNVGHQASPVTVGAANLPCELTMPTGPTDAE